MKTLTIGRGNDCDVVVDDYRISRRHALLKVHFFGKMEIVDLGKNGTWVNGVKLRSGVPFPVSRKDVVNLAEATQLNWSKIKDPSRYLRIGLIIAGIIALIALALVLVVKALPDTAGNDDYYGSSEAPQQTISGNLQTDSVYEINPPDAKAGQATDTPKELEKEKTLKELFPNGVGKHKNRKKDVDKDKKETVTKHKESNTHTKENPQEEESHNYDIL